MSEREREREYMQARPFHSNQPKLLIKPTNLDSSSRRHSNSVRETDSGVKLTSGGCSDATSPRNHRRYRYGLAKPKENEALLLDTLIIF